MESQDNLPVDEVLLKIVLQQSVFDRERLREELVFYINHILINDFNGLIRLLYTVDVDENKLKELLARYPNTDAGVLIADLMIQRQEQKIESRGSSAPDENISEEEKW